jgi:hypothetical protein
VLGCGIVFMAGAILAYNPAIGLSLRRAG